MTNEEIGLRIKEARIEMGLSLEQVGRLVGVAKSTIQRYEAGTINNIKLPIISEIARHLHVNPSWIIGKSEDKNGHTTEQEIEDIISALRQSEELRELMSIATRSTAEQIKKAIKILETLLD